MRIWLIQTGEMLPLRPTDRRMRSGHLAYELASRGHQVIWWSSSFDHMSKRWIGEEDKSIKINNNLELRLIKSIGYKKNVSLRRYLDHWYLAFKFKKQVRKELKPDIILSSLPDHHLAYEATKYSLKHNIPIIIDLRDLWPDFFVDLIKNNFLKKLVKILLLRDYWKTRFSLCNAEGLVTMMHSYLQIGSTRGGRDPNKNDGVFYLGAEKAIVKEKKNIKKEINDLRVSVKNKFIVLYIGTFNKICHPITLIHAAKSLKDISTNSEIEFILAGDGEYLEELKNLASDCPNVKFTGWVNNDEIAALLEIASVGVITTNEPFVGFVNKFFTYLSGGIPIISSLKGEIIELIESEGIGYSYQYDNLEELLEKILLLEKSEELRRTLSLKAKSLFDRRFDSRKIYTAYADYIEKCAKNSHQEE